MLGLRPAAGPAGRRASGRNSACPASVAGVILATAVVSAAALPARAQQRQLYWGETHLHTSWSVDAYAVGNYFTGPDEAYRFARGIPVLHSRLQTRVRIDRPLDFMIVADHAENFRWQMNVLEGMLGIGRMEGYDAAVEFIRSFPARTMGPAQGVDQAIVARARSDEARQRSWELQVDAAERHNEPGVFTTFAGWEWTRNPGGNQHRVVFTPAGPELTKQFMPFSTNEGPDPEDLWDFLERTSAATGADFIAMPHNSNLSVGFMFPVVDSDGRPIDAAYARAREKWEPVMEITQVKGTSEVHPALSPNDEFADFEIHTDLLIGGQATPNEGDYARSALLRGISFERMLGVNPYKLGFIGASDSHTGLATVEEDNFLGKTVRDTLPRERLENDPSQQFFHSWEMSASGIAAVWAEANTRDSIAAAFKRREVYGTSGPRMTVRFFGGFDFAPRDAQALDIAAVGYSRGVPMGGDLTEAPRGRAPAFLIHAARDPIGANLDRVQVIKGWIDANGATHERVYDAVWSGSRAPGADGKLPPVGDTVDRSTALYENTIGAPQLVGVWSDPDFDRAQHAFYYARVIEIPTPRHSTYDAVALGIDPSETGFPAVIQERAWSSPIWYSPGD